jgi:uncharacterized membrane-anchored protein YitT (DUF2179 family)
MKTLLHRLFPENKYQKPVEIGLDYVQISIGAIMVGLAYSLFYIPNQVVAGGVSGIGIMAFHLLGWPVGLVTLILNIPLFFAGLRWGGGFTTGMRTLFAIGVMSATVDLTNGRLPVITQNPLLYIAYGGLLDGAGMGLVFRAQGTTGGTDIIGRLLKRLAGIEISQAVFISNTLIVIGAALVFGLERALYGVLVAAVSAFVVDAVLSGGRQGRQAIIIASQWEMIRDALLAEMERGVTMLPARGAYTDTDRPILICVVSPTEVGALRRIIQRIEPEAFVIISATTEVWGQGFGKIHHDV